MTQLRSSSLAHSATLTALALATLTACPDSEPEQRTADAGVVDAGKQAGRKNAGAAPCVAHETPSGLAAERCAAAGDCSKWVKVEPPGAQCSDGSPYKFFVNLVDDSDNLVVMFEPGGACWDYESCSGGLRGAVNRTGIPDNHMDTNQFLNLLRREDSNPVQHWNMVFVPYCTGDVHGGDRVASYPDPAGGSPLTYRHVGMRNTQAVIEWLQTRFNDVPRLLVTGCSAGGIAALDHYAFIRDGLPGTQCGYLLDDSGPAFHSDGPSRQLHEKIREAWNLDTLLTGLAGKLKLPLAELQGDFGAINAALAEHYPHDRLGLAAYRMDLNYSLYSYERFFPGSTDADIHAKWWDDLQRLLGTFDTYANLAYFVPNFRRDNCSHCVSIPPIDHDLTTVFDMPWLGSEIESSDKNLRDFIASLLDDTQPLRSYLEDAQTDEDFTTEQVQMCWVGKP